MYGSTIDVADALTWLRGQQADLILTDPPHADTFWKQEEHREFVRRWYATALPCLRAGAGLVHSCGSSSSWELDHYLETKTPDQVLVWPFPEGGGHHFYLVHHPTRRAQPDVLTVTKPDPFYQLLIQIFLGESGHVIDPFCGRGEIPEAARSLSCSWAGCDLVSESVRACWDKRL